ncbi:MAG: hypothetical protein WD552_00405 [Candidatus Paceibacterota bacterium]
MKVNFTYDRSKDVWCLRNKGKSSNNSANPTEQYKQLVAEYGESPIREAVEAFINEFVAKEEIDIDEKIKIFGADWAEVSSEFQTRAEAIFQTKLPLDITAYLTVNSRCPYNIEKNFFFVSLQETQARRVVMHELWHFYTWYGLGADQEDKLGKEKYNNIKEALTALLNVECEDLFPKDMKDTGYPQHQELRQNIIEYWKNDKDIKSLWNYFRSQT